MRSGSQFIFTLLLGIALAACEDTPPPSVDVIRVAPPPSSNPNIAGSDSPNQNEWSLDPQSLGVNRDFYGSFVWRRAYIEAALQHRMTLDKFFHVLISTQSPDLIALGENHYLGAGSLGYERILGSLVDSGFPVDCIFLELSHTYQNDVDRLSKGKISAAEFIRKHPGDGYTDPFVAPFSKFALKHSAKMFAVDMDMKALALEASLRKLPMDFAFVQRRNAEMAPRIARLIAAHICRASVYIGGLGHFTGSDLGNQNLTHLLNRASVQTATVLISPIADFRMGAKTGSDGAHTPLFWKEDSWNPQLESEPLAFFTAKGDSPALLPKKFTEIGVTFWKDFTGVIAVP